MISIKKIKMRKINSATILAVGDIVFLKAYKLECTILNDITDGYIIRFDHSKSITYVTRQAMENHFLKIL